MAKDAVATMGTILTDDVGGRDAVHVAVISVKAGATLAPGQHVGFMSPPEGEPVVSASRETIGIVDPYLTDKVRLGQRFWLYLYPRTITSLRHNWTHPAFADGADGERYDTPAQKATSEEWIRNFIATSDCPDYETLIAAAVGDHDKNKRADDPCDGSYYGSSSDGEYLHFGGSDAHGEIPPEFWEHVEIVTGRRITKRPTYFSCSC